MANAIEASGCVVDVGEDDSGPRVKGGRVDIVTNTYTD